MWARTFGIVLILLLTTSVFSQKSDSTYQYNAGFTCLRGLIVLQYAHGLHLTYGRPWGVELFWNQRSLRKKEREKLFGYPQVGYSRTMIDTDMVETGKIFNAASYFDSLNVDAAYRFGKAEWVQDSKPAPNGSINWIEKQGFGEINTTELIIINHRLDVNTLGSGNLNLKLINPNEVWLSMRALSNVTISGELNTLHVFVDKRVDGRLYAEGLTVRDVSIWHGGSNDLFVGPSDILRGTIKGSGDVFLFREPDRGVVVNEEGSGRVINRF